jgi:hypothetical protein
MSVALGSVRSVAELTDGPSTSLQPLSGHLSRLNVPTPNGRIALAVTFGGKVPIAVVGVHWIRQQSGPRDADAVSASLGAQARTYQDVTQALLKADQHVRAVVTRFGARPRDIILDNAYSSSCC